jgi:hypothetical protein
MDVFSLLWRRGGVRVIALCKAEVSGERDGAKRELLTKERRLSYFSEDRLFLKYERTVSNVFQRKITDSEALCRRISSVWYGVAD